MWMIVSWISWVISLLLIGGMAEEASARRVILNAQQKDRLERAENVFVSALALTEKGLVDATGIRKAAAEQLSSIGFSVTSVKTDAHDVTLNVKCEERKTWKGVKKADGNVDRPGAPSRVWKGPACQLTYFLDDRKGPWQYEVRTTFENAWEAARAAGAKDSGQFALRQLSQRIRNSSFTLDLAAEWHQAHRLSFLLTDSETDTATKLNVLSLAGRVPGDVMLHALQTVMTQPDLSLPATVALGYMGEPAVATLMRVLSDAAAAVDMKAAAAEALGEIGSQSGNAHVVPPLLAMMQSSEIHLQVQTEIVKTLGRIPDQRSVEPLQQLGLKAWTSRSNDPHMQRLREAVDWSLWQINPSAHTED